MTQPVDFDNFSDNYNELLKESTKFFSSNEEYFAHYKVNIIRKKINFPVNRILEYGCGIGRNIPFLKAAFPNAEIVGSDIAPASLEIAKKENPGVSFFHENDDVVDIGSFDLVFVAGVFHHVPPLERNKVLDTINQRLSSNGRIIIFEHNPYNPITCRIVNNCPYDADAILLSPMELRKLLKQTHYSVEKQSYCLFVPPRFSKLIGIEKILGWLPLGGQYWIQAKKNCP